MTEKLKPNIVAGIQCSMIKLCRDNKKSTPHQIIVKGHFSLYIHTCIYSLYVNTGKQIEAACKVHVHKLLLIPYCSSENEDFAESLLVG